MAWSKVVTEFFEKEADDAVGSFEEDLDTVVRLYCTDPELAEKGVNTLVNDLPHHKTPEADGFVAWKMLHGSAAILAKYAQEAQLLLEHKDPITNESLTPEDKTPTVDDNAIRDSAGFHKDQEVADSSLTDKAKEHDITDADIGNSSKDESFVYKDRIFNVPDPATVYRRATRFLFSTLINECLGLPPLARLDALLQNNVTTRDEVLKIVKHMRVQLNQGLRIPRSDDQMS